MELFAATPKGDYELSLDQQIEMLGDSLPGHVEVPTEFIQSLAVVSVKLVQQCSSIGVGQSSKNGVHPG